MEKYCSGGKGLAVGIAFDGPHIVMPLHGEIDADNLTALLPVAAAAIADDTSLRIDLSAVTHVDEGALRQLLVCEACLGRDGVDVKLRNVPAQARELLESTHLTHLIETVPGPTRQNPPPPMAPEPRRRVDPSDDRQRRHGTEHDVA